jgi:hypothetical protein
VNCCGGHAWIDAYAARVRADMALYAQRGTAQVYWLTLPAPGLATHGPVWITENLGLEQAASGLAPGVRLIDLRPIFTPGFVFRMTMPVRGRPTVVRTPDRIHLSYAGGIVAARAVLAAMRAGRILPPRGA